MNRAELVDDVVSKVLYRSDLWLVDEILAEVRRQFELRISAGAVEDHVARKPNEPKGTGGNTMSASRPINCQGLKVASLTDLTPTLATPAETSATTFPNGRPLPPGTWIDPWGRFVTPGGPVAYDGSNAPYFSGRMTQMQGWLMRAFMGDPSKTLAQRDAKVTEYRRNFLDVYVGSPAQIVQANAYIAEANAAFAITPGWSAATVNMTMVMADVATADLPYWNRSENSF